MSESIVYLRWAENASGGLSRSGISQSVAVWIGATPTAEKIAAKLASKPWVAGLLGDDCDAWARPIGGELPAFVRGVRHDLQAILSAPQPPADAPLLQRVQYCGATRAEFLAPPNLQPPSDADRPADVSSDAAPDDDSIPLRARRVGRQFDDAVERLRAAGEAAPSDRAVYAMLERDGEDNLPNFATWSRYLREWRRRSGATKHTPRRGRAADARSVADAGDL